LVKIKFMKEKIKNEKELFKIAEKVKKLILNGFRVFLLIGDLGSGKTTFVKKMAKILGIKEKITSPTFILWQEYPFKLKRKKFTFHHLDLYRLKDFKELIKLGFKQKLEDKNSVFFIEWGEKIEKNLKKMNMRFKKIIFNYVAPKERLVEIK